MPTHPLGFARAGRFPALLIALAPAVAFAQERGVPGLQIGEAPSEVARHRLGPDGPIVTDLRWVEADGRVGRWTGDQRGRALDLDTLRRELRAAEHAARGGLTPLLAERLVELAPGDTVPVAFWLRADSGPADPGRAVRIAARAAAHSGAEPGPAVRAARRQVQADLAELHAAVRGDFEAAVRAAGLEPESVPPEFPFTIVRADAARVRALASRGDVDAAYLLSDIWAEEGDFAQGTLRTPVAWNLGAKADDSVRVLVNDTAQVQIGNPWLPPIIALNSMAAGSHATGVAGNIANRHPQYRAAAADLPVLYSAGGTGDVTAPQIWSDAIRLGIDVGNASWWNFQKGSIQFLDRFFDYIIREYSVMLFKSNGNQGGTSTPYATTPGNGYNMISVGAYSDQNTVAWHDDQMTSSSSWWNPIEGHHKPEVASPGTCVTTTGLGGSGLTSCFDGTSSASPLVAGLGAVLLSADNRLLGEMTTLKAALMASAWHNVEGAPLLSDRDGTGSVHAAAAHRLVTAGQWWHEEVRRQDFPGGVLDVPFEAYAGIEVRVVALWQSRANASFTQALLEMDLDLVILDPMGVPVASSALPNDAFEIAGFLPAVSGTYTARLTAQRFDGESEPLSVAWSHRNDSGHAEVDYATGGPAIAVGSRPIFRLRDLYTGAGKTYQAIASLGAGPGLVLPGGFAHPIGLDDFGQYSLTLPGFNGMLPASGSTRVSLLIPPDPNLAGQPLWVGMAVFGFSSVETVSQVKKFVIAP